MGNKVHLEPWGHQIITPESLETKTWAVAWAGRAQLRQRPPWLCCPIRLLQGCCQNTGEGQVVQVTLTCTNNGRAPSFHHQ